MGNEPRLLRTLVHAYVRSHENIRSITPLDEAGYRALIHEVLDAGCDAFVLDLEDYVAPDSFKPEARRLIRQMIKEFGGKGHTVFVRVNAVSDLINFAADLEAIICPELHGIQLSKTEGPEDIRTASVFLELNERRQGVPVGHTLIQPLMEGAAGRYWAYEICKASPRVAYIGATAHPDGGDSKRSIGWQWTQSPLSEETLTARAYVLLAARAAGCPYPIGGIITERFHRDYPADMRAFAQQNRNLGYTGMLCYPIPDVIKLINEVFSPTAAEIASWQEQSDELAEYEKQGTLHNPNPGKLARRLLEERAEKSVGS
jgi:citrate lyase subunit beta/citryl-CoA lyase